MTPTIRFGRNFIKNAAVFSASEEAYSLSDPIRFAFPGQPIYLSSDAEIVEHVMVTHRDKYCKSKIYWQVLRRLVGDALGTVEGDQWQWMRNMQQPFFRPSTVPEYMDDAEQIVNATLEDIQEGSEHEMVSLFASLNIRIILKILFGASESARYDEIAHNISDGEAFIAWQSKYPWRKWIGPWTKPYQRAQQSLAFFGDFVDVLMKEREASHQSSRCLMDELIDHLPPTDPALSKKNIRNEIIIHLGASTETMAVAESWALYLLLQHPNVLNNVKSELKSVTNGKSLQVSQIPDLIYLKQVLREAMRLYPPTHALVRDNVKQDKIKGYQVLPGDTMYLSLYGLHRNPRYWSHPNQFDPDRFEPGQYEQIPKYQYLPFGIGPHTCIGQHIAMPVMTLTLGRMLQRFEATLTPTQNLHPVSLSTLKPNQGIYLSFHPVKSQDHERITC